MLLLLTMWYYVYILQNQEGRQYVGFTQNIHARLLRHNSGEVLSTAKFKPWTI